MELNYKKYGAGQPFLILHGLFGSSDNWHTHGKKLAEYFEVYLIDQRNHGDSEWSDDFDYDIMAEDLHEFIEEHGLKNIILLGHSMGGKTAMRYAQSHPENIDKMIIVDMGIKGYPVTHDVILEGLASIDVENITSRREASEQLAKYVPQPTVRQFLLKNLHRDKETGFSWKINIPVLTEKLPEIIKELPNEESMVDVLFIAGGKSDYIVDEDHDDIRKLFSLARFYTIEEAGHWIHAEAPDKFMNKVLEYTLL